MLKKNLILAWRNLVRNKLHTAINIIGLAIGIGACLGIYRTVSFELSFNESIPDKERIYRIYTSYSGSFTATNRGVGTATYPHMRDNFTGIEAITHFFTYGAKVKSNPDGTMREHDRQSGIILASPSYFEVISNYTWILGAAEVLENPFQVVLTRKKAELYFGEMDLDEVMGRDLVYRDSLTVQVAGIVENPETTTDFQFTEFISYATIENSWLKENHEADVWTSTNSSSQLWIKLAEGTTDDDIAEQLPALSKEYAERSTADDSQADFLLQQLSDIHYNSKLGIFDNRGRGAAHLPTLNILILLALFLLVIAAINFINLETAQAMRKAKEVGVRKVLGSSRIKLISRFLTESYMVTVAGVVGGLGIAYYAFIFFEEFIPKDLTLGVDQPGFWLFLLIIAAIVGFLAGLYPAFVLASFKPVDTFKAYKQTASDSLSAILRKGLTVFQFWFSQILIAGSLIMIWQISFMIDKDLGFSKDGIVSVYSPWYEPPGKREVLQNELSQIASIAEIARMDAAPVRNGYSTSVVKYKAEDGEISHQVEQKSGDENYVSFFNMKLLAGRGARKSEGGEIVINDTYRKELGFRTPDEAIGIEVSWGQDTTRVVGVIDDIHFRSLHNKIEPLLIAYSEDTDGFALKLAPGITGAAMEQALEDIRAAYAKVYPDYESNVYFLDETVEGFYKSERQSSKLAGAATFVAILISCLGLFGLASYSIQQRTKELGIRKVLGASIASIMRLLSFNFMKLVVLAFILAVPVAYFLADLWLQDFAYRAGIVWWIFASTVGISAGVAIASIGYQATKAAVANPADSLRYE